MASPPDRAPRSRREKETMGITLVTASANVPTLDAHSSCRDTGTGHHDDVPAGRLRLLLRTARAEGIHIVGVQVGRWPSAAQFQAD
eukprot:1669200-Alexandrium_andersonii.AAC.1